MSAPTPAALLAVFPWVASLPGGDVELFAVELAAAADAPARDVGRLVAAWCDTAHIHAAGWATEEPDWLPEATPVPRPE